MEHINDYFRRVGGDYHDNTIVSCVKNNFQHVTSNFDQIHNFVNTMTQNKQCKIEKINVLNARLASLKTELALLQATQEQLKLQLHQIKEENVKQYTLVCESLKENNDTNDNLKQQMDTLTGRINQSLNFVQQFIKQLSLWIAEIWGNARAGNIEASNSFKLLTQ